jgi:hypothetical protein
MTLSRQDNRLARLGGNLLIYLLLRQQPGHTAPLLVKEDDETVLTVNLHYGCRHQPLSLTFQQNTFCILI